MSETDKEAKEREKIKNQFGPVVHEFKLSPLPWRVEQNSDKTWFIYDKNFGVVADKIRNEGDAIIIVNTVNYLKKEDRPFT